MKARKRKPASPESHKQRVDTTRKQQGNRFFNEIGALGGHNSPTKFTGESGKAAANARWEAYRALSDIEKRQLRERKINRKGRDNAEERTSSSNR